MERGGIRGCAHCQQWNASAQGNSRFSPLFLSPSFSLSLYRHAPLKGWRATFYRDKHRAYEARRPPSDTLLSRASLRLFLLLRIFTMRFHDRDLTAPFKTTFHISSLFSRALVRVSRGIYSLENNVCAHLLCAFTFRKRLLKKYVL